MSSRHRRIQGIASKGTQRGLTIVELLTVLAVIALLAGLSMGASTRVLDEARVSRTTADLRTLSLGISQLAVVEEGYRTGTFPLSDMAADLAPFVGRVPTHDAWGHPVVYVGLAVALEADGGIEAVVPPRRAVAPSSSATPSSPASPASPKSPTSGAAGGSGVASFRITSFGKDGVPDADGVTGIWVDYRSDIVFEGGTCIQGRY